MRGRVIELCRGEKRWALGKFAEVIEPGPASPWVQAGDLVFTANVAPLWRDPHVLGWSLNYALWRESQQPEWNILWFFLHEKGGAGLTHVIHRDLIYQHMLAAGKGEWGQNLTVLDEHWERYRGKPPDTVWIDTEQHPLAVLRISPQLIEKDLAERLEHVITEDELRAQAFRGTLEGMLADLQAHLWSDEPMTERIDRIEQKWVEMRKAEHKPATRTMFRNWLAGRQATRKPEKQAS